MNIIEMSLCSSNTQCNTVWQ